jgi:very-short-patch-repair endonuclease
MVVNNVVDGQASTVVVDIEAASQLSVAMVENSVPLVARISLTNTSDAALSNLTVELALLPDFSAKWTAHVSAIPPGGTFHLDTIELPLDRDRLVNQLERSRAELMFWVRDGIGDLPIATRSVPVDVLAYNEWSPLTVPHLLAAYVLPNHPAVSELLSHARIPLERITHNPALDGYQSGSPARVAAIAQAVYESMAACNITYSNPPASFEEVGQKIRTPEQVLKEQLATCLDVSVLLAACLEQAGLHPMVVLVQGHAFPGVWLEDFYTPEAYIDDPSAIRKLVELDRLLVFDSSSAVQRPAVPFAEARRRAASTLAENKLLYAVDIRGARKLHFRPLPMRVAGTYAAAPDPVVVAVPAAGPTGLPRSGPAESSGKSRSSGRTKRPRIEAWKQRLLDTSLHNRLLNYRDLAQTMHLLAADLGPIEDALASGEELQIRPRPTMLGGDDPRSKRLLDARVADDAVAAFLRERLAHGELYSDLTAEKLTSKLTAIYRAAREAVEETGSNPLCVTFGMLDWFESESSEKPRRAPILLVPVALVRNARAGTFTLQATGEDVRLNVTLFEKLRIEYGITVPELAELPLDDAGVNLSAVLRAAREAIINLPRWEIRDELHLGLFSFAKFQLWADLDQNIDLLLQSTVLTHILAGKGEAFPNAGAFPEARDMDARFSPKDLLCPLDADASQLAAVAAAAEGKTFVLQGPPGTGKSQTITNLIAHAIALGKRVLFVAEKSAALEVVQRRLTQIGLAPYVLELHSHKAGKLQVLEQFRVALESQPTLEPPQWDTCSRKLAEARQHLNTYLGALHGTRSGGKSIFQVLGHLGRLRGAPAYPVPPGCTDAPERFEQLRQHVDQLRLAMTSLAPVAQSAWQGCRIPGWQLDLPSRVAIAIDHALRQIDGAQAAGARLSAQLGANPPASPADIDNLAQVAAALNGSPPHGEALRDPGRWPEIERDATQLVALVHMRNRALTRVRARYGDGLFAVDLDVLAAKFHKLARAFFLFAWWGLRGARKTLRVVARDGRLPASIEIVDDLEQARAARDAAAELARAEPRGREIFGLAWNGDTDATALDRALSWSAELRRLLNAARPGLFGARVLPSNGYASAAHDARTQLAELGTSLTDLGQLVGFDLSRDAAAADPWLALRTRLSGWRSALDQLRAWCYFLASSGALASAGCGALVDAAARGELPPEELPRSFEHSAYQAWFRRELAQEPVLNMFDGEQQLRQIASFADLDRQHLTGCAPAARARVSQRLPASTGGGTGGEMGVIQRQLQKRRGHMPIRKLLAEIPSLAARLKPAFLMSPMSVAAYLDPNAPPFDLVVFDEASQIPTHDAIGVLARGKSAVVVGDSKQLPPTSFFESSGGDDDAPDDNAFEELESILDECIAAGFPERRLDWHYRSRHESLIAFSNHHYYKNRLNTFPSAITFGGDRGVRLHPIAGVYDKGESRTNRAEAHAVVADLVARLRSPDADKQTYGVVTFSQAQQKLVEDLLDRAQRDYPEIERFFAKTNAEPVIVKNLENIQGDERDVIIFSICYGPDATGKTSMNFGPLNRDGGERRLNVAITRAREELVVYATLRPEHIDLTRTKAVGVKHLKTFLDYASRGPVAIAEALTFHTSDEFDSPFEEQVCDRLRALGFEVDTQVGTAGYRIDLGVRHPDQPGRYVLAVECDGAHYHSARSARERDRLRTQVLEGLGWRIHRVWSTDWWQTPDREVQRIVAAIEKAKLETSAPVRLRQPVLIPELAPAELVPAPIRNPRSADSRPTSRPAAGHALESMQIVRGAPPGDAVEAYRIAPVPEGRFSPEDVHDDRYRDELRRVLLSIVQVEAPISLTVLARRIAPCFAIQRTSSRLEERLRTVLGRAVKIKNDFIWRVDQDPETYASVRLAPAEARREAQEVPLEEAANAAAQVLRANIALSQDELVKLTAKSLGFPRASGRVAEHLSAAVVLLVKRGSAQRDGNKVVLA